MPLSSEQRQAMLLIYMPSIKRMFPGFPRMDIAGVDLANQVNFQNLFYDTAAVPPVVPAPQAGGTNTVDQLWGILDGVQNRTPAQINRLIRALTKTTGSLDVIANYTDFSGDVGAIKTLMDGILPLVTPGNEIRVYKAILTFDIIAICQAVGISKKLAITGDQFQQFIQGDAPKNLAYNNGQYFKDLMTVIDPFLSSLAEDRRARVMDAIIDQAHRGPFDDTPRVQVVLTALFGGHGNLTVASVYKIAENPNEWQALLKVLGPLLANANQDAVFVAIKTAAHAGNLHLDLGMQNVLAAANFPAAANITERNVRSLAQHAQEWQQLMIVMKPLITDDNQQAVFAKVKEKAAHIHQDAGMRAVLEEADYPAALNISAANVAAIANHAQEWRQLMTVMKPLITNDNRDVVFTAIQAAAVADNLHLDAGMRNVLNAAVGAHGNIRVADVTEIANHLPEWKELYAVLEPLIDDTNRVAVFTAIQAAAAVPNLDQDLGMRNVLNAVDFPARLNIQVGDVAAIYGHIKEWRELMTVMKPLITAANRDAVFGAIQAAAVANNIHLDAGMRNVLQAAFPAGMIAGHEDELLEVLKANPVDPPAVRTRTDLNTILAAANIPARIAAGMAGVNDADRNVIDNLGLALQAAQDMRAAIAGLTGNRLGVDGADALKRDDFNEALENPALVIASIDDLNNNLLAKFDDSETGVYLRVAAGGAGVGNMAAAITAITDARIPEPALTAQERVDFVNAIKPGNIPANQNIRKAFFDALYAHGLDLTTTVNVNTLLATLKDSASGSMIQLPDDANPGSVDETITAISNIRPSVSAQDRRKIIRALGPKFTDATPNEQTAFLKELNASDTTLGTYKEVNELLATLGGNRVSIPHPQNATEDDSIPTTKYGIDTLIASQLQRIGDPGWSVDKQALERRKRIMKKTCFLNRLNIGKIDSVALNKELGTDFDATTGQGTGSLFNDQTGVLYKLTPMKVNDAGTLVEFDNAADGGILDDHGKKNPNLVAVEAEFKRPDLAHPGQNSLDAPKGTLYLEDHKDAQGNKFKKNDMMMTHSDEQAIQESIEWVTTMKSRTFDVRELPKEPQAGMGDGLSAMARYWAIAKGLNCKVIPDSLKDLAKAVGPDQAGAAENLRKTTAAKKVDENMVRPRMH